MPEILSAASTGATFGSGETPIFPCPNCGRVYQWKTTLNRHLKLECGMAPQFPCLYCNHRSKRKHDLMYHMRSRHGQHLAEWEVSRPSKWFPAICPRPYLCGWKYLVTFGCFRRSSFLLRRNFARRWAWPRWGCCYHQSALVFIF